MRGYVAVAAFVVAGLQVGIVGVEAQQEMPSATSVSRESLNDAWWTGPILAASGATLPRGHSLIEPYFYDVREKRSNSFGTSSYVLYGLTNELTVGTIPAGGYNMVSNGLNSSSVEMGDLTLLAQHRFADPAWEYSVTRNWVLALDAAYRHNRNTHVAGFNSPVPGSGQKPAIVSMNTGSSESFVFAPAIEYNFRSNFGVIVGTRVIPASHNTNPTITPVLAINFVH